VAEVVDRVEDRLGFLAVVEREDSHPDGIAVGGHTFAVSARLQRGAGDAAGGDDPRVDCQRLFVHGIEAGYE
jgi:hypothetical protein